MKGQVAGQVFVFVLATILFGLILLYGYKAIMKVTETKSDVQMVQFKNNLISSVNRVRHSYGSKKFLDIEVSTIYKQICFVDLEKMTSTYEEVNNKATFEFRRNELGKLSKRILGEVDAGGRSEKAWDRDQNVFFMPASNTPISVGRIEISEPGFFCSNITVGPVRLVLEGKGDRTYIKPRPAEYVI